MSKKSLEQARKNGHYGKLGGRPPKYNDPAVFAAKAQEYIDQCKARGDPILWTGLALHLGYTSRQSLDEQAQRPGFSDIVARARMHVESAYEQRLLDRERARGAEFVLKNMGWEDRTVHDVSETQRVIITDEPMSIEDYRQRHGSGRVVIDGEADEVKSGDKSG